MTEDLDRFQFNTAIAALMEFYNALHDLGRAPAKASLEAFVQLLSPFAPHVAEEMWASLGRKDVVSKTAWPSFDESALKVERILLVVQVNGTVRAKIEAPAGLSEDQAKDIVLKDERLQKWLEGKSVKKAIYIPNKLLNLVIG